MLTKQCKKHGLISGDNVKIEKITWKLKDGTVKEGDQLRCLFCRREKDIKWTNLNRDKKVKSSTEYKKKNREAYSQWCRQDRMNHPEKYRKWRENSKIKHAELYRFQEHLNAYELSIEMYNQMLDKQNNRCAICGMEEKRKSRSGGIARLCVDHCHETKKIRGLLCHGCNAAIGHLNDSIGNLISAIEYLANHSI